VGAAIGRTTKEIFHDNTKAWTAPLSILGCARRAVLQPAGGDRKSPANGHRPTVLDLFGVSVPEYMDGKPLTVGNARDLLQVVSVRVA